MQDDQHTGEAALAAESAHEPTAAHWQLAVLDGLHAGALVDLAADDWTLIGCAEDCDVVLRDARVRPHHAALFVRGGRLQVRAIEGELLAQGRVRAPGDSVVLDDAQTWQLAAVTLGVGRSGSAAWDALRTSPVFDAVAIDSDAAAAAEAAATASEPGPAAADADADGASAADAVPPTPSRRRPWPRAPQVMTGVAACAVIAVAAAVAWAVVWPNMQARENSSAMAGVLAQLGMPELRVVEASNGHLRIEGAVHTESDRARLMQALRQRGLYPAVDIVSGEQLAGTVQNGFRQRGMEVKAQYTGNGRVEVRGAAPSPVTEQVVQDVLAATNAVTQVALLDTAASAAAAEPQETVLPSPAPQANNAGNNNGNRDPKRIVGVVGGDNPFVLTADRRHYFVGSMLSDGTQVDHIEGSKVTFSRNGKPTAVQF